MNQLTSSTQPHITSSPVSKTTFKSFGQQTWDKYSNEQTYANLVGQYSEWEMNEIQTIDTWPNLVSVIVVTVFLYSVSSQLWMYCNKTNWKRQCLCFVISVHLGVVACAKA